ncbi:MAG TPA: VOC family protein [Burkholderiales bacterium]|nr:VOC family protein [Burkholderiales bacterium]
MAIAGLDHYALLSSDAERTTRFYEEIVGLKVGFRPELSFPGVWLYAGDDPVVHVIFGKPIPTRETGAVDHLAFKASGDIKNSLAKLDSRGIEYSMRKLQRTGVVQVFFRDPDGVGVELNFQPDVSY